MKWSNPRIVKVGVACVGVSLFVAVPMIVARGYAVKQISVVSVRPAYADLQSTVTTIGKVVPVNEFQARANFPGMVEKIEVQVGDKVKPGQLLIKIKDTFAQQRVLAAKANLQTVEVSSENVQQGGSQEDLINMEADREKAEREYRSALDGLSALRQIQATGAVSDAEIGGATQRLQNADASLKAIKKRSEHRYSTSDIASWSSRVADARSSLAAQKIAYSDANIRATSAGTVYLIPVKAYDFVPAGADLLHIADLNRLEVRALFDEDDIGKLHDGDIVTIAWEGRDNHVWHGHVARAPLAAMVSGTRNVGECIIAVDDADGTLPLDTNVTVTVIVKSVPHALTVPHESLHMDGGINYVYRITKDRLVRTPVALGLVELNQVQIICGVNTNDVIALRSVDGSEIKDGVRVMIRR